MDNCLEQFVALGLIPKWVEPTASARPRRGRPASRGRPGCLEDRSSPTSVLDLAREVERSPCASSQGSDFSSGEEETTGARKRQRIGAPEARARPQLRPEAAPARAHGPPSLGARSSQRCHRS